MIISYHTQEFLKFFDGRWCGEVLDSCYFGLEWGEAFFQYRVAEELDRWLSKEAFVRLKDKAVILEVLEDDTKMLEMLVL